MKMFNYNPKAMDKNENNPLLKDFNLDNLRLAVDGIKKMDIDDRNFDISIYGGLDRIAPYKANKLIQKCDTIACFLGWFPFVEGLGPIGSDYVDDKFDYIIYCERILGIRSTDRIWDFLFSGTWHSYDDTLYGALARAELVLAGKYPENWSYFDYHEGWSL